ncbi:MAG: tRNA guanosine(34) transglycosylase Tgt [Candidatus Nephthysia bennettiae]|uniref:Queuine tRNA-ribosyltransferase n=1 Tax=Candidatus Nephthysia bennettiae TaxID=3127016 RepID=A0A934K1Z2_9BACT|nr:tRNA guanosine(34) transglycosylase Tgt [Candidatus Dormibacteraeota bacterium]MBJ7613073.1 tRNA guanosine(34) transglycosylase Tgt [Candidatus Dormibacteraeota bacterium]PZR98469.1 MAG: tRNA guanosine(34) transglycosylase Tgt [Candidatus Dormibacteraeota bacterium]
MFEFQVLATDRAARRGVIRTDHGELETPAFFAVATRAALKGVSPDAAWEVGVRSLICNAYHLTVQPGPELVEAAGGLHRFMGWPGVLATDSGGFQIFSLRHGQVADEVKGRRRLPPAEGDPIDAVRVDEEGADFRSYLDGSRHRFTPENNMALQRSLGADLLFCLDECTPFHVPAEYTRAAMERNARWARRCLDAFHRLGMEERQALFGIVHGGVYPELRRISAAAMAALPFSGFGIGDCLGESKQDWYRLVELVCPLLPEERPRHLLGVGEPDDLVEGALRGIDTFDCAMPTRIARHGQALVQGMPRFRLDLAKAERRGEDRPIEEGCPCTACRRFGRAYLHHLFRAGEMLGIALAAEHNLAFTARLMARIREAISAGSLAELRAEQRMPAASG